MLNMNRRGAVAFASAAAAAGMLFSASHALAQTNLIVDPSFAGGVAGAPTASQNNDQPMTTGPWKGWNNWVSPYSGYYTTAVTRGSDTQAAKTFSGPNGGIYQFVAVSPGNSYTASAWFDNASADAMQYGQTADVRIIFFSGPNGTGTNLGTVVSGTQVSSSTPADTWTQLSVTAAAPAGAQSVQWMSFFNDPYYSGGAMFVEDASLLNTDWNGGGADSNWSTAGNWGGVAPSAYSPLVFAGTNKLTNTNDIQSGTPFYGLSFLSSAGAYNISGNQINLVSDLVNNSTATQTLNLPVGLQPDGTATSINFNTAAGNVVINGTIDGAFGIVKLGAKTLTIASPDTYTGPTNVSAGTLIFSGAGALPNGNELDVAANATVVIQNTGTAVGVQVGTFNLSGKLDLNNNLLDVPSSNLSAMSALVVAGYNGGRWNGASGIVSTTAANDNTHLTALGVIVNDNGSGTPLYGAGGTVASSLDGVTPQDGDILVKYTYYGDTNLDGKVTSTDYARTDNGYLNHLTGWYNGDFNYDGVVNGSDYTLIDNAFNQQGAQLASEVASATAQIGGSTAVPEPTTVGLLGLGASALLARRRRHH